MSGRKLKEKLICVDCERDRPKVRITPMDGLPRCLPCRKIKAQKILRDELVKLGIIQ